MFTENSPVFRLLYDITYLNFLPHLLAILSLIRSIFLFLCIFSRFFSRPYIRGNGVRKIKRYLEEHGIKTVTGKTEWSTSTIDRMLSNEKYVGEVLMQKTYVVIPYNQPEKSPEYWTLQEI